MNVEIVIKLLQKIKQAHPSMTNEEILKILEIKTLMEIKAQDGRR